MIVLIGCVKTKQNHPAPARELYCSPLFRYAFQFARTLVDERNIYILSAEYGLVPSGSVIRPYERTLNSMSEAEKMRWAYHVCQQMEKAGITPNDRITYLCGENYRKYIIRRYPNACIPLRGVPFGRQLAWYKQRTEASVK